MTVASGPLEAWFQENEGRDDVQYTVFIMWFDKNGDLRRETVDSETLELYPIATKRASDALRDILALTEPEKMRGQSFMSFQRDVERIANFGLSE